MLILHQPYQNPENTLEGLIVLQCLIMWYLVCTGGQFTVVQIIRISVHKRTNHTDGQFDCTKFYSSQVKIPRLYTGNMVGNNTFLQSFRERKKTKGFKWILHRCLQLLFLNQIWKIGPFTFRNVSEEKQSSSLAPSLNHAILQAPIS